MKNLQHWRKEDTPSDEEIIKKILDCAEMELISSMAGKMV